MQQESPDVSTQVERVITPTRPTKQPFPTTPLHTDKEYLSAANASSVGDYTGLVQCG
jgi:hypothetical protein